VLKLILLKFARFFPQLHLYGFSVAFWTLLFPFLTRVFGSVKYFFAAKKHKAILMYLYKHHTAILNNYLNENAAEYAKIGSESTIWVCWWDGLSMMPELVKICYNYLLSNTGKHQVQLITKENYMKFVSFPDYIINKLNNKTITLTHFSDILRVNLLCEYGGIWMDATVLLLNTINLQEFSFFTLKAPVSKGVSLTLTRFDGLSTTTFSLKKQCGLDISRWSGFLLAGTKGFFLFKYLRDILYAYWMNHNDQIDYLLVDYFIALANDHIPAMKKLIHDIPCSGEEKFSLENNLNCEFSDNFFSKYLSIPFHKLTWKKKFNAYTNNNKLTTYGHLLKTANL
jgi:hypothetical protein